MLVTIYCAAVNGLDVTTIAVEVSTHMGVYFHLSGLPDSSVKESQDRIRAAFLNIGLKFPHADTTVNMSPADIQKSGSGYDLPIAIGILASNESIKPNKLTEYMMVGELGLDGTLRSVRGALPIAMKAKSDKFRGLIVPEANVREAAVVDGLEVYGMNNLSDVIDFLNDEQEFLPAQIDVQKEFFDRQQDFDFDFADVKGQENVKRALEVAASGGHNLIMVGPPGSGKSMMAKCLPSILPPLSLDESL